MYAAGIPVGLLVDSKGPRPGVLMGGLALGGGYFMLHRGARLPSEVEKSFLTVWKRTKPELVRSACRGYVFILPLLVSVARPLFLDQSKHVRS